MNRITIIIVIIYMYLLIRMLTPPVRPQPTCSLRDWYAAANRMHLPTIEGQTRYPNLFCGAYADKITEWDASNVLQPMSALLAKTIEAARIINRITIKHDLDIRVCNYVMRAYYGTYELEARLSLSRWGVPYVYVRT